MQHMNSEECAEYLGVHVNTLRKYVNDRGLPVLRFPGERKHTFRKDLVDAWVYEMSQPKITVNGKTVSEKGGYGELRVLAP